MLMKPEERTTILLKKETVNKLKHLKMTDNQTMDEVVNLLIFGKVGEMQRLKNEIKSLVSMGPELNLAGVSRFLYAEVFN